MKRFFDDECGATSVLIVFMMLVFVILGAYSITSAHANYEFSGRALEWKEAYYNCNALAEEFLRDTDNALAAAEKETAEAVLQGDTGSMAANSTQSVNELYKRNVLKELSQLSDKYTVEIDEERTAVSSLLSIDGGSQIKVCIAALPFRYSIERTDSGIRGALKENGNRCAILEWRQIQRLNDDNAVQDPLWNGVID